ncbi:hypothetical protein [Salipiger abyssi]|uniref:hypothetical protein n=1 Tax=Salipiger abyssi TaxID=1250539 RepID=UPI0009789AE8|nr:hypothetical protein [Salipiger abyssi]
MQLINVAAVDFSTGVQVGAPESVFFSNATVPDGKAPFAAARAPRAFFGDAMGFSGATAGNNTTTVSQLTDNTVFDGTEDLEYFANNATIVVATDYGIAGAFAATSKNTTSGDKTITIASHMANHDTDGPGWALYLDAVRMPGAGSVWGGELQVGNKGISPTAGDGAPGITPHGRFLSGSTRGLTIGSGADPNVHATSYPVDVALYIAPNGSTFYNGITFGPGALEPWADGGRRAINMQANGTRMSWFTAGAAPGSPYEQFYIAANMTGAASSRMGMRANDSGLSFLNDAEHPFFFLNNGVGSVALNYVAIGAAGTGSPARIYVDGVDDDADLLLDPAGAGHVRMGSYAALAGETASGTLTIKDANGVLRKLSVVS